MPRVFVTGAAPLIWICIWMLAPRSLLNQTGASLNCGWSLLIESALCSERDREVGNTGQGSQQSIGRLATLDNTTTGCGTSMQPHLKPHIKFSYQTVLVFLSIYHLQTAGTNVLLHFEAQRSLYTYICQFNIQQFYVLPTQCIYVFCVDLRTNSDYFPIQH